MRVAQTVASPAILLIPRVLYVAPVVAVLVFSLSVPVPMPAAPFLSPRTPNAAPAALLFDDAFLLFVKIMVFVVMAGVLAHTHTLPRPRILLQHLMIRDPWPMPMHI